MNPIRYTWHDANVDRLFELSPVPGTHGHPYNFGEADATRRLDVADFYIATTPVTQPFWAHVMGEDPPSCRRGPDVPLENVSWDDLTRPRGFLDRLNVSALGRQLAGQASLAEAVFRLPSDRMGVCRPRRAALARRLSL